MRDFFVNQYIEELNGVLYMRFLYDSSERLTMKIFNKMYAPKLVTLERPEEPTIVKVPIDEKVKDVLHTYKIYTAMGNAFLYKGYYCRNGDKFGFLSCNDNPITKVLRWNKHHDGLGSWVTPVKGNYDITIHMGDNIYGDSVWKDYKNGVIDINEARVRYNDLFSLSYSETFQGQFMRNGIHIHIIDDHDVTDDFGYYDLTKDNAKFKPYADMVIDKILNVYTPYIPTYTHHNHMFHLMDTRMNVYNHGVKYPLDMITKFEQTVEDSNVVDHFFISQQPLAFFTTRVIKIIGLVVDDAIELCQHKNNVKETSMVLAKLARLNNKPNINIRIVSGDIHAARIQRYKSGLTEMVTSGITRRTTKNGSIFERFFFWLMTKISFISIIDTRLEEYGGQNMGSYTPKKGFKIVKLSQKY